MHQVFTNITALRQRILARDRDHATPGPYEVVTTIQQNGGKCPHCDSPHGHYIHCSLLQSK